LLAPRPTPKLEDHTSSAVRGCLFNLFTATLHIGGRSSIRNLRTRHAVVTGTHIHGDGSLHVPITPEAKGGYSVGELFIFSSHTLQSVSYEQNAEGFFPSVVSFLAVPPITFLVSRATGG
jgi:hypothetical protein